MPADMRDPKELQDIKEYVYDVLCGLATSNENKQSICYNVRAPLTGAWVCAKAYRLMAEMWVDWPEFSGHPAYPIPGRILKDAASAHEMFWRVEPDGLFWEGRQGQRRYSLVLYLLDRIEKEWYAQEPQQNP
jgi:hypothetical protein